MEYVMIRFSRGREWRGALCIIYICITQFQDVIVSGVTVDALTEGWQSGIQGYVVDVLRPEV